MELEREKKEEFAKHPKGRAPAPEAMTIRRYAEDRWLELKHGPHTRRPSPTTYELNASLLKPFLETYGDRELGAISRVEALDWSRKHPHNAKVISALFNDAVDDQLVVGNPFAKRRQAQSRGRRDINPLTEDEVERLAAIAGSEFGVYGKVCAGWILFLAWVGCRPGEAFKATWEDLDFERGEVTITRVKPPHNTDTVVFPERAQQAVLAMPVQRHGRLFSTSRGRQLHPGNYRYFWDPVREDFMAGLSPRRRAEIVGDRPNFDLYELRHLCASVMADRGLNEFDIAHQLGNSPQVCRETYIHAYRDRTNDRVRLALNREATVIELKRRQA
jgi:integrase